MRNDELFLVDIYEHAILARDYVRMHEREKFSNDVFMRAALTHLIQVIGEASSKLSEGTKSRFPNIPWVQMIGMRNRLVHAYFHIDFDLVHAVAMEHLDLVISQLDPEVRQLIASKKTPKGLP